MKQNQDMLDVIINNVDGTVLSVVLGVMVFGLMFALFFGEELINYFLSESESN